MWTCAVSLLLSTLVLLVLMARAFNRRNEQELRKHLLNSGTDSTHHSKVCNARINFNIQSKKELGLFLGHGWSSAAIFKTLVSRLDAEQIPYYCPRLTGFGTLNTSLLRNIDAADWEADILAGIEVLKEVCREIVFVGYSVSGSALHLLRNQPAIRSIHLINPDIFFTAQMDSRFDWLFGLPGQPLARLADALGGWFERDKSNERRCIDVVDPACSNAAFDYTHASFGMLRGLHRLRVSSAQALAANRISAPLYLYLGGQSRYLDLFATIEAFHKLAATRAIRYYPKSGHMLPVDAEAQQFIDELLADARSNHAEATPAAPSLSTLTTLERTSLVPLKSRVVSALDPNTRYTDPAAISLYLRLGLHGLPHESSIAHVARTRLIDEMTKSCVRGQSTRGVVSLGVGLCTRIERLGALPVHWYDVESQRIIKLRSELFDRRENNTLIVGSVLEDGWMHALPTDQPLLFVAEGLFLFLEETEVERLVTSVGKRFPGSSLLFDSYSNRLLQEKYHRRLADLGIRFKSGIDDIQGFAQVTGGRVIENRSIFAVPDLPWRYPVSLLRKVPLFRNMARVTLMQLKSQGNAD